MTIARSENQETRLITKSKPPTEQSNAEQGHKVFIQRKPSQKATSSSFLVTRPPTPPRSVASTKPAAQQTGDHSSVPPNRTLHSYQFGNPALINARALAHFGHDTQVEFLKGDCVLPLGHPKD